MKNKDVDLSSVIAICEILLENKLYIGSLFDAIYLNIKESDD